MGSCILSMKPESESGSNWNGVTMLLPSTQTSSSKGIMFNIGANSYVWDLGKLYDEAVIYYSIKQYSSGIDYLYWSSDNSTYTLIVSVSSGSTLTNNLSVENLRYIKCQSSAGYSFRNIGVLVKEDS